MQADVLSLPSSEKRLSWMMSFEGRLTMEVVLKVVLYSAVSGHCRESSTDSCSSQCAAAMHCSSFGVVLLMLNCMQILFSKMVL